MHTGPIQGNPWDLRHVGLGFAALHLSTQGKERKGETEREREIKCPKYGSSSSTVNLSVCVHVCVSVHVCVYMQTMEAALHQSTQMCVYVCACVSKLWVQLPVNQPVCVCVSKLGKQLSMGQPNCVHVCLSRLGEQLPISHPKESVCVCGVDVSKLWEQRSISQPKCVCVCVCVSPNYASSSPSIRVCVRAACAGGHRGLCVPEAVCASPRGRGQCPAACPGLPGGAGGGGPPPPALSRVRRSWAPPALQRRPPGKLAG